MIRILREHTVFQLNGIDQTELARFPSMAVDQDHIGPEVSHEQAERVAVAHGLQDLAEPQGAYTVKDAVRAQASPII